MQAQSPPLSETPIEAAARRKGLLVSVFEGISAQVHASLTGLGVGGNAFTFGFALHLGAGDLALGLVAAIPPIAGAAQLVSAWFASRLPVRRDAVAVTSTVARSMWLLCGLLPFLFPGRAALTAFLACWIVSSLLLNFSGNLWVSWMADLVPPRIRGRYFALRSNVCNATGIAVGLGAGYALDHGFGGVPRAGEPVTEALAALRTHGFLLLFALAAVFGVGCYLLLRVQAEPRRGLLADPPRNGGFLREAFVAPFAEAFAARNLRGLLLFVAIFGVTNGLAVPFWQPFQLENLRLPYTYVSGLMVVISGLAVTLALPVWGRVAARVGNRAILAIALAIIATLPYYYLVATPEHPWPVLVETAFTGIAWSGYNLAVFNLALALVQGPGRERLFAVYVTIAGVAQAAASVVSGAVVSHLPAFIDLGIGTLHRRQVVFLLVGILRIGCVILFLRVVREPGGKPIRAVIASIPAYVKARMDAFKFIPR